MVEKIEGDEQVHHGVRPNKRRRRWPPHWRPLRSIPANLSGDDGALHGPDRWQGWIYRGEESGGVERLWVGEDKYDMWAHVESGSRV